MNAINTVAACAISALALGAFSFNVAAQQLYRIVGPDGKVTFSDQPPPAAANAKVTPGRGGKFAGDGPAGNSTLPAELRPIATRYPVTIYTGKDCGPCNSARNMLSSRGVPFTEKTIESNQDIEALQRLSGENSLPFATIGGQQLKGYSDQEWSQYLDAAGYPKASVLPASFRNPAPTPMVARATAAAPVAEAAPAASAPAAPRAAAPAPANPAGIKF
jgi:glutaredoxin